MYSWAYFNASFTANSPENICPHFINLQALPWYEPHTNHLPGPSQWLCSITGTSWMKLPTCIGCQYFWLYQIPLSNLRMLASLLLDNFIQASPSSGEMHFGIMHTPAFHFCPGTSLTQQCLTILGILSEPLYGGSNV